MKGMQMKRYKKEMKGFQYFANGRALNIESTCSAQYIKWSVSLIEVNEMVLQCDTGQKTALDTSARCWSLLDSAILCAG